MTDSLARIVLAHLGNEELHRATEAFFAEVDDSIARHEPVCRNRGACCRFDSFGHRLYATSVELIYFVRGQSAVWRAQDNIGVCPFHVGGACVARPHRPLGCRVFYCDHDTRDWPQMEYERRQRELGLIAERFGVDYRYVEWLSALREMDNLVAPAIGVLSNRIDNGAGDMID